MLFPFASRSGKQELKVFAPRAGTFVETPEATAMLGLMALILGRPERGPYRGDYWLYHNWLDSANAAATAAVFWPIFRLRILASDTGSAKDTAAANSASDKFFHVQVGPYADVKDAEAMRARLIADGYNPIVKK